MYADDTQMIQQTTIPGIPGTIMKLQSCIEATQEWYKSRRLQLNPAKTELIWFGSKANLKKMADLDLNLYIGADIIKPVGVVRDLGVFSRQWTVHASSYQHCPPQLFFFIFGVWNRFDTSSVQRLPQAWCQPSWQPGLTIVTQSLQGLPQSTIDPLQRVQNAAARLVAGTGTRDHITPVLQSLHWLPIKFRIV